MYKDMALRAGLLAGLLLAAGAPPLHAAQRRALLVGINQYKDPAVPELRGSENDVALMAHTLKKQYGFADADLRVLVGKQATRKAILDAFDAWLVNGVKPGDVVCFCFSGHGAQTPDKHGDEPDGLDEFLLPYDFEKKAWKGGILDDEVGELVARIPTDNVTLVIDACHSGTMTRGGLFSTPKFVPPPTWVLEEGDLQRQSRGVGGTTPAKKPPSKAILLAASAAAQRAEDAPFTVGGRQIYHGAMVYYLTKGINSALGSVRELKYQDSLALLKQELKTNGFNQEPQLEGPPDRLGLAWFGGPQAGAADSQGRILRVAGGQATVDLGGYEGVVAGSVYGVYPPQASAAQPGQRKAALRVSAVREHEADGALSEGGAEPGDRVFQEKHAMAQDALKAAVQVEKSASPADDPAAAESAAAALRDRLKAAPNIQLAERPDLTVRKVVNVSAWQEGGAPLFAAQVRDRNGQEGPRHTAKDTRALADAMLAELDAADTLARLAQLRNPNPGFQIRLWANTPGQDTFRVGEKVSFKFVANRDCHLLLLDLGPGGDVTVLFPNESHQDAFARAGRVYTIPSAEMNFDIRVKPPTGREFIKAIATVQPVKVRGVQPKDLAGSAFRSFARSADAAGVTARGFVEEVTTRQLFAMPKDAPAPAPKESPVPAPKEAPGPAPKEPPPKEAGAAPKVLLSLPLDQWSEASLIITTRE